MIAYWTVGFNEIPKEWRLSGIYRITKVVGTIRSYIGSSTNVYNRLISHLSSLRRGNHHSIKLQRAFNKHGEAQFFVTLLETSSKDSLNDIEQMWIDRESAYSHGFNCRPNAESTRGMVRSEESKVKARESNLKTWQNPELRKRLSDRFKGVNRSVWTEDAAKKRSDSMKAAHAANPEWRKKIRPKDEAGRVEKAKSALRKKLEDDPEYRARHIANLHSNEPGRVRSMILHYFEPIVLRDRVISSPIELASYVHQLRIDGKAWNEIGRILGRNRKFAKLWFSRLSLFKEAA